MRKPRSQSRFAALSPAQLKTLERWLAVENRTYAWVVEKCRTQFGFKTNRCALSEFYGSHFAAIGIEQHRPRPALLTLEISFWQDKIQLRVLGGAKMKGKRR